jgi:hypothetical protein
MGTATTLTSFGMGNSNNSLATMSLGSNGGGQNNGGGFGGSNMDMDKQSTQVTIPKDVSLADH